MANNEDRPVPQALGHEAHCSAGCREDEQCCCLYPELERLWRVEAKIKGILEAQGWSVGTCADIQTALEE